MPTPLIDTIENLTPVCRQIAALDFCALDTEFIRQRTFYPQLCLIQIAVDGDIHCVDPLAIQDLSPLMDALADTRVIIHSARQDIEALLHTTGRLLAPVYDTQIAAGLTGIGDQISYSALVKDLLDTDLGKGETRTNWAQRPLSDAQIHYAEDDVRYLLQLFKPLKQMLEDQGRTQWHQAECQALADESLYVPDPEQAWKKVKGTRALNRSQRRAMKRLASWRERHAQQRDKPRKWIMSDADIIALASGAPDTSEQVCDLLQDGQRFLKNQSSEILAEIIRAQDDPMEEKFIASDDRENRLTKICMKILRNAAEKNKLSPAMLGTRKDIVDMVRGSDTPLLHDWRLELVGRQLQETIAADNQ